MPVTRGEVRLAELVATLSLGIDLGLGQPMEHIIRECLNALRMSEALDFTAAERAAIAGAIVRASLLPGRQPLMRTSPTLRR